MSNSSSTSSGGGIGIAGCLTIIFIVLKLIGVIHWPWIWVLSPLWISLVIGLVVIGIVLAIVVICDVLK